VAGRANDLNNLRWVLLCRICLAIVLIGEHEGVFFGIPREVPNLESRSELQRSRAAQQPDIDYVVLVGCGSSPVRADPIAISGR
jgi:hypothetical protein